MHQCDSQIPFALLSEPGEGVAVESLAPGTTVEVRTRNSRYRFGVDDGARRLVQVTGGHLFPVATRARLEGSTTGGSIVRCGWIGVGLRMELTQGIRRIVSSPVASITVHDLQSSSAGRSDV
ncbi:MAG TPA: hypothetical protein VFV95_16915 [Vicinamibacterales bacterium]|nr:hypothetical protein [Vicinamibacterales bacterium]